MAHGKTLELRDYSTTMRILMHTNRTVQKGNPDHYFAKGGRVFTHLRVRPEMGDRRKYRAIVRRERAEALELREAARAKEAAKSSEFTLDDDIQ